MILAQLTDTHLLPMGGDDPRAQARVAALEACIDDINGLDPAPDAVIHTGDICHNADADSYALAGETLARLNMPAYLVPGNRDDVAAMRGALSGHAYLGAGGFANYVIDAHAVRLIGIDSRLTGRKLGLLCAARLDWLDQALRAVPDRPTWLYMHHPAFYVDDAYPGAFAEDAARDDLFALLARHGQVERLICGHLHRPASVQIGKVQASSVPSVAPDLSQDADQSSGYAIYYLHHGDAGQITRRQCAIAPAA